MLFRSDRGFLNETLQSQDNPSDPDNFMDQFILYVDKHIHQLFPKQQDARTADAIMELFRKRETLEIFNKKALYIYIREITDTSTPHITRVTKKLDILVEKTSAIEQQTQQTGKRNK